MWWRCYLDEDPGEAAHAEQHGDGQQDVGHQAQQHRGPVDLNRYNIEVERVESGAKW